ncbi:MAG: glycosyltransferase family 39 protein [Candidatus Eisenbacteria bacterium]|nr:glycosyltransferase family 39 protein [Candidatus Eisenbacteria bacterium]
MLAIAAVTILLRVWFLPGAREDRITPDGARFLNLARCISRGEGFSTPEAWPAWLNPARLPAPETFKEPGYPYAIAALTPIVRDPFRAALWISLLAGLLLPFVVHALGRRLEPDPWVAWLAAMFAAASPVLIEQSVYVMAESLFALLLLLSFLAAAPTSGDGRRFDQPPAARPADFVAGIFFGLSFLVRGQALLAAPALVGLLWNAPAGRVRLRRLGAAAAGTLIAVAPFIARNLRIFGSAFHSEVAAFGLWPYADQFQFTHSLARPPSAVGYALAHLPRVARYAAHGLWRFARYSLPHDLLGHPSWLVPLAIGGVVALRRPRVWGFALGYPALTMAFILGVYWVARYFASVAPLLCLIAGLGAALLLHSIARAGAPRWVQDVVVVALLLLGSRVPVSHAVGPAAPDFMPELSGARHQAAFLRAHTRPDQAVMAEATSYWAWFSDRPAVHPVVADSASFEEVMRRLNVRYAALPTSRLAEFAARYPGGRLPSALVFDHVDPADDVTVFEVRPR